MNVVPMKPRQLGSMSCRYLEDMLVCYSRLFWVDLVVAVPSHKSDVYRSTV